MVDLVADIRPDAPTFGKIIAVDLPADHSRDHDTWIWVPPGFAHGNLFTEDSLIEYLCSGEYSPGCEAGISPLAEDLDWSWCDDRLQALFQECVSTSPIITDKDRDALSLSEWAKDPRAENFMTAKLEPSPV
jgi:dTDP-4-dehydrorhamnose 3,5-epimerase-like enzyme